MVEDALSDPSGEEIRLELGLWAMALGVIVGALLCVLIPS